MTGVPKWRKQPGSDVPVQGPLDRLEAVAARLHFWAGQPVRVEVDRARQVSNLESDVVRQAPQNERSNEVAHDLDRVPPSPFRQATTEVLSEITRT